MKSLFSIKSKQNGKGKVVFSWERTGNLLAVCGSNRRLRIYNRQGKLTHQFGLKVNAPIKELDWDCEGEILAVMQERNPQILLWDSNSKKTEKIETNAQDLTFLKWSKTGPQLAIGSSKGTLLIYNKRTLKLTSIKGKLSKSIRIGCWSRHKNLLCVCDDRSVSINNETGDTIEERSVKESPRNCKFIRIKKGGDEGLNKGSNVYDDTLCVNLESKLWVYEFTKKNVSPVELSFNNNYGKIVKFKNFGDGYLMVGFTSGIIIVISTHIDEIGQEINTVRFFKHTLMDLSYSDRMKKGVAINGHAISVFSLEDLNKLDAKRVEKKDFERENNSLGLVKWTKDGNILTVSSKNGNLYSLITSLPVLHDSFERNVIYMTSLRQLCIKDIVTNTILSKFPIDIEPSFLAIGRSNVGVGMNNRIWYYKLGENGKSDLLGDKEYLGTVEKVKIGLRYVAVLSLGKVALQLLEFKPSLKDKTEKFFPENEEDEVTCFELTNDFLIYSTQKGYIVYFSLSDWKIINHFRFDVGITKIYSNHFGTKLIFIDDTHSCYLYNPLNDDVIKVENFSGSVDNILWDYEDQTIFVTCDKSSFYTYIYTKNTVKGAEIKTVRKLENEKVIAKTKRPDGFEPILLVNGRLVCHMPNGYVASITLDTHQFIEKGKLTSTPSLRDLTNSKSIPRNDKALRDFRLKKFHQLVSLKMFDDAYDVCEEISENQKHMDDTLWKKLADESLYNIHISVAIRCYRKLKDAAKVMTLEGIQHIDELNLLLGYLAMFRKDFAEAEQCFLQSSGKRYALEMRRDLMHWDSALKLAEKFDSSLIPEISREYAQQLELQGDIENAFINYSKSLQSSLSSVDKRHVQICREGIARTQIKRGYHKIGFNIAMKSGNKKLCRDCGALFEKLKLYHEASQMYVKAEMYEKAAYLDLFTKNYKGVEALLSKLDNPKILIQFAKAMESENHYKKAVHAYDKAGDFFNVVRVYLEMGHVSKPIEIVKRTKSIEGAEIIALYCMKKKNYKRAIEFYVLAKKFNLAFNIASKHDEMEIYSEITKDVGSKGEFAKVAEYYQSKNNFAKAGDYYRKLKKYNKCVENYFKCGNERIDELIELCGETKNSRITNEVLSFILGEMDSKPKDLKYLFRFNLILKDYKQAVRTALLISEKERELGNYKGARRYLFDVYQELIAKKIHVPQEITKHLIIIQSYCMVKDLSKLGEFQLTARMLLRVCDNITMFKRQDHVVSIYMSTIVFCNKAKMFNSSFQIAIKLLQKKENKKFMEKRFYASIVKFVRNFKRKKMKAKINEEEAETGCPFCSEPVKNYSFHCYNCQNVIPFCIITGRHMLKDDWSCCPNCKFHALYSKFSKVLEKNNSICPMCEVKVPEGSVVRIKDVDPVLKRVLEEQKVSAEIMDAEAEENDPEDGSEGDSEGEGEESEGESEYEDDDDDDDDDSGMELKKDIKDRILSREVKEQSDSDNDDF